MLKRRSPFRGKLRKSSKWLKIFTGKATFPGPPLPKSEMSNSHLQVLVRQKRNITYQLRDQEGEGQLQLWYESG